jgi:hypothetical protein
LGRVALAQGDHAEAVQRFRRALSIALEIQFVRVVLSVLVGVAACMFENGQVARGVALCVLVVEHPSSEQDVRERAQESLARYRASLSPGEYAAAVRQGQEGDLEGVVQAVQAELASFMDGQGETI